MVQSCNVSGSSSEWGQPVIVASRGSDIEYRCRECDAGWVGPSDDYCEWCHKRWVRDVEAQRNRLLFPEWLSWGDRYFDCNEVQRSVWAQTRGITGDFAKWQRDLFEAVSTQLVTDHEQSQALRRHERWMTHSQKPEGLSQNGT